MKKLTTKIFFGAYQFFRAARYAVLRSGFGYVSSCKHSPTCGTYMLRMWEKEGFRGALKGIKRIASCW